MNVNTSGINNAYYWDYLSGFQGSNQEDLIANVTVSPLTPIGHIAEFTVHINNLNGGLDISFPVSIAVGQIVEGFENDFSSSLNWEFAGNQAWQITDSEQYEGLFSAKSGDINDNQSSQISVELDVVMNGNIEFFYKVASEYSTSGEYFYDGLEYGNYSREYNSLNITVDIDTNCDQDTLPVMLYYDIGHMKVEDNETVWNGYMYNNYFFNVTGWEGNEYQLTSGIEYFTEPYTGWYMVYVNLFADWDRDGEYDYVSYFYIDEIILEEP